jgi:polyisoprenoid-binding protein YceI
MRQILYLKKLSNTMNSFTRAFTRLFSPLLVVAATSLALVACNTDPTLSSTASRPVQSWAVDNNQSAVNFVTTKAGQAGVAGISENQTFKRYAGGIDTQGKVSLVIDLASVDTGVDIRDERLRTMLWNVKATPQATFTAQLSGETLKAVGASGMQNIELNGQLQMAGQTKPVVANVRVSRLASNQLLVVTRQPILINANDYGLRAGVEAMREVMGLNFLAGSAPVSFSLVLNAK